MCLQRQKHQIPHPEIPKFPKTLADPDVWRQTMRMRPTTVSRPQFATWSEGNSGGAGEIIGEAHA